MIPQDDMDIIKMAGHIGLCNEEILDASVLARRRIHSQTGIELIDIDEHVIAQTEKKRISSN